MEKLENTNTVVDPFSEEAIIASLPLEAQGELKSYGAMEDKSINELHDIMLHMRDTYAIPPWHPFTYLMKWYAAAEVHGALNRDTMWAHSKYRRKEHFDVSAACGIKNWVDVVLHTTHEGKDYYAKLYVDTARKIAWSHVSETPRSGHGLLFYAEDGSRHNAYARWDVIFSQASRLEADGKLSGTFDYAPLASASEVAKASWETRRRNLELGNLKPRVSRSRKPEMPPVEEGVQALTDNKLDSRILIPMFELAKVKALELGMTDTVKLWEEAIHG